MKKTSLYYVVASALSILVFWFFTLPIYQQIIDRKEDINPLPERSVMIKKGTGLSPVIWDKKVAVTAPSQSKETVYNGNILSDTLTSRETVYLYPYAPEDKTGKLELMILSDSLSGSTSGIVYLDRNMGGIGWYSTELLRLNGSINQQLMIDEEKSYEKIRLRIVANSSTQATLIKAAAFFKRT